LVIRQKKISRSSAPEIFFGATNELITSNYLNHPCGVSEEVLEGLEDLGGCEGFV
jgi:hypothetical protein